MLRVVPLLLALWMWADMGLDANQARTYHEHAFDTKGSYRLWANEYRNTTNDAYLQTVSPSYFYVACLTWILPPFLLSILLGIPPFAFIDDGKNDKHRATVAKCISFCSRTKIKAPYGCCVRALYFFLSFAIFILLTVFGCYIIIPMMAIFGGIRKLLNEDFDEDQDMFGLQEMFGLADFQYKNLPWLKLLECFGEAIPQLILGVVYISNNYPYLKEHDDYFGIGVPVSVISCVFSFVSVVIGVFTGCKAGNDENDRIHRTWWF